jgi:hypothetical protein
MRSLFLTICFLVFATMCIAQDCKTFLFMSTNAQIEMTIYDKKGKAAGVQSWNVTDVKNDGNGYSSTINTLFKDEKGKEISKGTGLYKCSGGMLQADMQMVMPPQPQLQTSDVKLSNAYIEYPYTMTVGESLKDAQMEMDLTLNSGMKSKVNFKETNRKVNAKESVTTPAGTWDAYQISYDANMRIQMGPIGVPTNFTVKEWYVPGIG